MALSPPDGQPLIIAEIAPPKRTLTLAGRDRPEQGVSIQGRQRATQSHYPGTHSASVQFMGTAEEPIVLRGWFQDPLSLVDGGPQARMALLRGLMQGGSRCLLQWGPMIIRQGRVADCKFEIYNALRVRYEITFEVDEPNEAVALTPIVIGVAAVADFLDAVNAAVKVAGKALETARAVRTASRLVT